MKKNPEQILRENIRSWGKGRRTFSCKSDEIKILIKGGSRIIEFNEDNGDGTFSSCVIYGGKEFKCSHLEKISLD